MEKIVSTFEKNVTETVKVGTSDFNNLDLIFVRVWVQNSKGQEVPTKKGLTLKAELYPQLKEAIDKLGDELVSSGLLSDI